MIGGKSREDYEIIRDGSETTLMIDANNLKYVPSVEDSAVCMSTTIEKLAKVKNVTRLVFNQKREFEYSYVQTKMLLGVAHLYLKLSRNKTTYSLNNLISFGSDKLANEWYHDLNEIIFNLLKSDPLGAFVKLKRMIRHENSKLLNLIDEILVGAVKKYISLLNHLLILIEGTELLKESKPYMDKYKFGEREVYRKIFYPTIKPDFMFTKLMANYPENGEELANYNIGNTEVVIFKLQGSVKYLYHLTPPEFKLSEEKYNLLDSARNVMAEHKPTQEEFTDPQRMREVFYNVGRDLMDELANSRNIRLKEKELDELTSILVRYTIGFGLIEVLLSDEQIQDISINSPLGTDPMYIVHGGFGDCTTNIIPTRREAESWASKLRMISGRPLDEANPLLDTEITLPGATSRVSAITAPLAPMGLAFSFRRHRDKPWTLPLFIKVGMISPLAAGLMSFLIDGTRTMLIAGTRSSGKTSLLGSLLIEIMRRYRVITIEDTFELPTKAMKKMGWNIQPLKVASALAKKGGGEVDATDGIRSTLRLGDSALIVGEVRSSLRGDQEVIIIENNITKRIPIKSLENKNLNLVFLPTLDKEGKMKLKKLSGFVKHPKRNKLIKLITKSGREVTVTPDHSVFTHVDFKIAAIDTDNLKINDPIIIPAKLPCNFNDINYINLLDIFKESYRLENAEQYIRKAIKVLGWKSASKICEISDIYRYLLSTQKTRIPIKYFLKLMEKAKVKYDIDELRIKRGTSNSIPANFPINENIMRLLGYYLSEGNISNGRVQITNSKLKIIEDVFDICSRELGLKVSKRSIKGLGTSTQMFICSKPFSDLLIYFGCGKTSLYKRIPDFVYGLNEKKICALLKGMYSGDGSISSSKGAGNLIRYFSTSKKLVEDVSYALLSLGIVCRLHSRKPKGINYRILYTAEIKQRKYCEYFINNIGFTHKKPKLFIKSFSHTTDDSVRFNPIELEKHLKLSRKYRHLRRTKSCSKDYLKRITEEIKCSDEIYDFAHGDFFIDRVKSIEWINLSKEEHVYDLEVKSTQRFVGGFGGILLHNTEALALYEAMRIGAAANVVAGTVHADSPYGVYDRVVNDIGVPKTSFKATDIIIVANPIKSADGIHRYRRVTEIAEVTKNWENDPLLENGFVTLFKYNVQTDTLEPSSELINGESDVLKMIAGNIKELAGDWDGVWSNIELRGKIKEELVKRAEKEKDPDLLEAEFVVEANDNFHLCSEMVKLKYGNLDSEKIFFEWKEWFNRAIKKRKIERNDE